MNAADPLISRDQCADLMTIEEMISVAFDSKRKSTFATNFKLVEVVLAIIAQKLDVLDRQVRLNMPRGTKSLTKMTLGDDTLLITEMKVSVTPSLSVVDGNVAKWIFDEEERERMSELEGKDSSRKKSLENKEGQRSVEKIIAVEYKKKKKSSRGKKISKNPETMVTKDKFNVLAKEVQELQKKVYYIEEQSLFGKWQWSASLAHPIAMLELSDRLDRMAYATEQIVQLMDKMTRLSPTLHKFKAQSQPAFLTCFSQVHESSKMFISHALSNVRLTTRSVLVFRHPNYITPEELEVCVESTEKEFDVCLNYLTHRSNTISKEAAALVNPLGPELGRLSSLYPKANELEMIVSKLSEKHNGFDSNFNAEILKQQNELTAMDMTLDKALDNLANNITNIDFNKAAVLALYGKFRSLLKDLVETRQIVEETVRKEEIEFELEVQILSERVDEIKAVKAERAEVVTELSKKASLGEVNALISIDVAKAVVGNYEFRIEKMHKFVLGKENTWQMRVNNFLNLLSTRADKCQLENLEADFKKCATILHDRVDFMIEICEYVYEEINRLKIQKEPCLSCDTRPSKKGSQKKGAYCTGKENKQPAKGSSKQETQAISQEKQYEPCFVNKSICKATETGTKVCPRICKTHTIGESFLATFKDDIVIPLRQHKIKQMEPKEIQTKPCKPCIKPKKVPAMASKPDRFKKFYPSEDTFSSFGEFGDMFMWSFSS